MFRYWVMLRCYIDRWVWVESWEFGLHWGWTTWHWGRGDSCSKVKKVRHSFFLLRCVTPAALPLVAATRFAFPGELAEWTTAGNKLNVQWALRQWSHLAEGRCSMMFKKNGPRIRTHDLWIRQRVCYPQHHSATGWVSRLCLGLLHPYFHSNSILQLHPRHNVNFYS